MLNEAPSFHQIIPMIQVFRMENNRWPSSAVELLGFSDRYGRKLDLSGFHTLKFTEKQTWTLSLDYSAPLPGGEWANLGRFEISRIALTDSEQTFRWRVVFRRLARERLQRRAYCLRPEKS